MKRGLCERKKMKNFAIFAFLTVSVFAIFFGVARNSLRKKVDSLTLENTGLKKEMGVLTLKNASLKAENTDLKKKKPETTQNTKRIVEMKVTAYCPCEICCGEYADGMTSTGRNAWTTLGVAADSKLLKYGTKLFIPGVGERIVDDTGGAMRQSARQKKYHIDLRCSTHAEAKKFGVQYLKVEIL